MSQTDLAHKRASTFLGIESTFGTLPSMTRVFPCETPDMSGLKQDNQPVMEERVRGFTHQKNVQGLKGGSVPIKCYVKPDTTQLASGSSPATPWLGILLKAALGAESYAAGSTITAAGSDVNTVVLASGHGSRFPAGTWAAFEESSALHARRVKSVSTDTVEIYPDLAGTPTNSGVAYNSYTYYPSQTNTNSLSLQHAKAQDSNSQWTCKGGRVDKLEIKAERGKLIEATATINFATWTGPSDQSISVAAASDGMAAPMVVRDAITLVQAPGTTTTTQYPLHSLEFSLELGNVEVPEMGGVEGVTGMMRVPQRPVCKPKLTIRIDPSADSSWYASQTSLGIICIIPYGSGTSKRFVVFDFPTVYISNKPMVKEKDGRTVMEIELECLEDSTTNTTTDLALAPFRIALI